MAQKVESSVLGVAWSTDTDDLVFSFKNIEKRGADELISKRSVLKGNIKYF